MQGERGGHNAECKVQSAECRVQNSEPGPKGSYEVTGTPRGSNGEQGDCGPAVALWAMAGKLRNERPAFALWASAVARWAMADKTAGLRCASTRPRRPTA